MTIEIRNKVDGRVSVANFEEVKREMVRALAAYLIEQDLVSIEVTRGNIIVSVDVNMKVKSENS
jgi:hypothetical protein